MPLTRSQRRAIIREEARQKATNEPELRGQQSPIPAQHLGMTNIDAGDPLSLGRWLCLAICYLCAPVLYVANYVHNTYTHLSREASADDYIITVEVVLAVEDEYGMKSEQRHYARAFLDTGLHVDYDGIMSRNFVNRFQGFRWMPCEILPSLDVLGGRQTDFVGIVQGRWAARRSTKFLDSRFLVQEDDTFDVVIGADMVIKSRLFRGLPFGYAGLRAELPAVDKSKNSLHQQNQDAKSKQNVAEKQDRRNKTKSKGDQKQTKT
ncbi:hypothetical protein BU23DRAFT_255862 [Bimuria novae-zelandiae CBS 107.79]|uniref:Uncharacterized protein n=1 Tax=Bimuria novae-zelandiae CBS 107.79 TaxID=1447943 RepID=A0A6A5UYP2_9PLEO|nr:hypothetical protein BU23DRAFT_255862 [Bimuria novae-zelandiae CBS 107.79]